MGTVSNSTIEEIEKEERERAVRACIRNIRIQTKEHAKGIRESLESHQGWHELSREERICVLGLLVGLFRQNLN